jgi:hypothetical protein
MLEEKKRMMLFVLKQILRWLLTELIGVLEPILVDFGFPKHNVKRINYHGKKNLSRY